MRCVIVSALVIALGFGEVAATQVLEVPLPQFEGYYSGHSGWVYASFVLPQIPAAINGVSLHITGNATVGTLVCWQPVYEGPLSMWFMAEMQDTVSGHWWAADGFAPNTSGEFELTVPFVKVFPTTSWDYLRAGHGTVQFIAGVGGMIPECYPSVYPTATIAEVSLLIDGDLPIAVEQRTWGAIKALYR